MKVRLLTICLLLAMLKTFATLSDKLDTLHIDLDKDLVEDSVIFDRNSAKLICKLSTQQFKTVSSKTFDFEKVSSGIHATKKGFKFSNNYMRTGYDSEFAYNKYTGQIQLIEMKRYEFGPANNDGSGESIIDMLTNIYIANWNYYDLKKDKLIKMPPIQRKMILPVIYLSDYSDDILLKYQDLSVNIFEAHKALLIKKSNTQISRKTFTNTLSKNVLQVNVFNPCALNIPPWDADSCTIEAKLTNSKGVMKVLYDYPEAKMSLIYFDSQEVIVRKINGLSAVIIPFYYCGNSEEYDRKVSYIIFYKNLSYLCHLNYSCENEDDCRLQAKKVSGGNLFPLALQRYFLQYVSAKHRNKKSFHQD
jgi:hypothetical protein